MKSYNDSQKILQNYGLSLSEEEFERNKSKKVVCGMSGGVDSSVSAALLQLMGHEVLGIFMRNWEEIDEQGKCSAQEDFKDVVAVCESLEIDYYSLDFSKEYKDQVFNDFLNEYRAGYTPNPDILCNKEIKFKVFFQKAMELGADYFATGHYCRTDGEFLYKGVDANKDQSYFLYAIDKDVLKKVIFPLGGLEKPMVRKIARDLNLVTHQKKDSTGICFIGERNFKKFLSTYIETQKGSFIELESKKVLGPHDGACFYTKGQRKGLGIGGPGGPFFVAGKDMASNDVFVVEGENHPALFANSLYAHKLNWISKKVNTKPGSVFSCQAKIRYRQKDTACTVKFIKEDELYVNFDNKQRAITCRQSIVFYSDDVCLGGGIIKTVGPSYYDRVTSS